MNKEQIFAQELIDFVSNSTCSFYAVKTIKQTLLKNNFVELDLKNSWDLEKEGKYFITKNDSAIIAFVVGNGEIERDGFKIVGAHTDSPSIKIKPNPESLKAGCLVLNTEPYGGPIINTWFDRPLSLAGRVALKSDDILNPEYRFIDFRRPLLMIPNLAIHFNRKVNEGVAINPQKELIPILSMIDDELNKDDYLLKMIAEELTVDVQDILDVELLTYEFEKGCLLGANEEFISCGRLDDLAMVHAGLEALVNSKPSRATNVLVCFDNEEIGSSTRQGANSPLLRNLLERITLELGKSKVEYLRCIENSFLISSDMAQAVHPNYAEKYDPSAQCIINKGPTVKISAKYSYSSDGDTISVFEQLCKKAQVPCQKFVNRSDERGGMTIGPITASNLGIRIVDVGNPMLAMHSIREFAGVYDHYYIKEVFKEFYNL
ncbi:M18 family aminopeptidase [Abyssisolibacter fermentans]|uniref:M18 family aminopeptidase n=1 Tax=Abyssisolibacter fermentans TaxID=1766203 RepID=UPI000829D2EA|nr:M18 family aminopeptidase [Abyssisolibacter fermentans]